MERERERERELLNKVTDLLQSITGILFDRYILSIIFYQLLLALFPFY